MNIHLIAIGGAAMHNLALALQKNGIRVSGSDDEIYNPARERLASAGLLPAATGWFPEQITTQIDLIILGMHARKENPELIRAQELGIPIVSYPEYIYRHARDKKRVVIAGSHGKTTTTSLVMHLLQESNNSFDYLVGAQLHGFDHMVQLSAAPCMIIEGDEYLSSALDLQPKFLHYHPHIAVITGIAWDHMNVFPTFETYLEQFRQFIHSLQPGATLYYYAHDPYLQKMIQQAPDKLLCIPYESYPHTVENGQTLLMGPAGQVAVPIFGQHNLENLSAAIHIAQDLGVAQDAIIESLRRFSGPARRLQVLEPSRSYLDFAHAPSKVKASLQAVRERHPEKNLVACLELHTYSSLNKAFLPQYQGALDAADKAVVYFDHHTLAMKKLPPITNQFVQDCFANSSLQIINDPASLFDYLRTQAAADTLYLMMSSGNFGGLEIAKATGW